MIKLNGDRVESLLFVSNRVFSIIPFFTEQSLDVNTKSRLIKSIEGEEITYDEIDVFIRYVEYPHQLHDIVHYKEIEGIKLFAEYGTGMNILGWTSYYYSSAKSFFNQMNLTSFLVFEYRGSDLYDVIDNQLVTPFLMSSSIAKNSFISHSVGIGGKTGKTREVAAIQITELLSNTISKRIKSVIIHKSKLTVSFLLFDINRFITFLKSYNECTDTEKQSFIDNLNSIINNGTP